MKVSGGLVRAGRTDTGYTVLRRVEPGSGPIQVVIEGESIDRPGRLLSIAGVIGVVLLLVVPTVRKRRRIGVSEGAS